MNPYEVLEISPGASPEEIKSAYHRAAKQWHPDRFTGDAKAEAERRFRSLAEAFNMLKDIARQETPRPEPPRPAAEPAAAAAPAVQIQLEEQGARGTQPKSAEDWFTDAKTAFEGKAYGRALALILYALRSEPERAEFHAFHGKVLDATGGDNRTKVRALETAIKHNPKDVDSMILLAKTYQGLGMQARATRLWEVIHNQAPNHPVFNKGGKGLGGGDKKAKAENPTFGEQWTALVAEAKITIDRIFKRG